MAAPDFMSEFPGYGQNDDVMKVTYSGSDLALINSTAVGIGCFYISDLDYSDFKRSYDAAKGSTFGIGYNAYLFVEDIHRRLNDNNKQIVGPLQEFAIRVTVTVEVNAEA